MSPRCKVMPRKPVDSYVKGADPGCLLSSEQNILQQAQVNTSSQDEHFKTNLLSVYQMFQHFSQNQATQLDSKQFEEYEKTIPDSKQSEVDNSLIGDQDDKQVTQSQSFGLEFQQNNSILKQISTAENQDGERVPEEVEGTDQYRAIIRPRGLLGHKRVISLEALKQVYHLPITSAARQLGVGVTVLKKYCRKFGISRWPYRKLKSMDKLIESVEYKWCQKHPDDRDKLQEAVEDLRRQKQFMHHKPSLEIENRTKKLRQANFKQEYKWRQTSMKQSPSELPEYTSLPYNTGFDIFNNNNTQSNNNLNNSSNANQYVNFQNTPSYPQMGGAFPLQFNNQSQNCIQNQFGTQDQNFGQVTYNEPYNNNYQYALGQQNNQQMLPQQFQSFNQFQSNNPLLNQNSIMDILTGSQISQNQQQIQRNQNQINFMTQFNNFYNTLFNNNNNNNNNLREGQDEVKENLPNNLGAFQNQAPINQNFGDLISKAFTHAVGTNNQGPTPNQINGALQFLSNQFKNFNQGLAPNQDDQQMKEENTSNLNIFQDLFTQANEQRNFDTYQKDRQNTTQPGKENNPMLDYTQDDLEHNERLKSVPFNRNNKQERNSNRSKSLTVQLRQ